MSATQKQAAAVHVTADEAANSPLLDQILTEMNSLASRQTRVSPVRLRTLNDIERFAEIAKHSGMVPKDYIGKKDMIIIAVQMGSELGLPPMQSLQNIAVVNGRPSVWGDALPGLCRASGMCRTIREWHEGAGDDLTYYCEAVRKDDPNPVVGKFSVAQAKRAGLWKDKPTVTRKSREGGTYEADSGPWYSYSERMLQMRARGFGLRDAFPDVLKGLITAEEAMDTPADDARIPPPRMERPTMGEQIGDALPAHSAAPKRTLADVINELDAEFTAALTRDAVDIVLASEKCQKALDFAKNGAKERLEGIIKIAINRTETVEDNSSAATDDSDFPGDRPSNEALKAAAERYRARQALAAGGSDAS